MFTSVLMSSPLWAGRSTIDDEAGAWHFHCWLPSLLVAFSDHPALRNLPFTAFFSIYSVTLIGNRGMVVLITSSSTCTPWCTISSVCSPYWIWATFLSLPPNCSWTWFPMRKLSFTMAVLCRYVFSAIWMTESFLLAAMAYDRYTAVCNPLHYSSVDFNSCVNMCTLLITSPNYSF